MLRDITPPLGFGKRCPSRVAYRVRSLLKKFLWAEHSVLRKRLCIVGGFVFDQLIYFTVSFSCVIYFFFISLILM